MLDALMELVQVFNMTYSKGMFVGSNCFEGTIFSPNNVGFNKDFQKICNSIYKQ